MIARRLLIRGRVQGVGYRDAMMDAAQRGGVAGWVRNRSDATVEAFVQGDADAVAQTIAWCRRGPPQARVTAVDVTEAIVVEGIGGFTLRSTI